MTSFSVGLHNQESMFFWWLNACKFIGAVNVMNLFGKLVQSLFRSVILSFAGKDRVLPFPLPYDNFLELILKGSQWCWNNCRAYYMAGLIFCRAVPCLDYAVRMSRFVSMFSSKTRVILLWNIFTHTKIVKVGPLPAWKLKTGIQKQICKLATTTKTVKLNYKRVSLQGIFTAHWQAYSCSSNLISWRCLL